jgi:hypothetical protein
MMWLVAVGALVIGLRWSIALAVIAYVIGYVASCWWFPWVACRCCKGRKRHWSSDGKKFRMCFWCAGRGRWYRVGRLVWNALTGSAAR